MAPVEVEVLPSPIPLTLAVFRVAAATYASYTVGRSLHRSHKALGPAQETRNRTAERAKLTVAFSSLAALGLVFAVTSSLEYLALSYRVWASERGVEVPESFSSHALKETPLYLTHWLSDTPVFLDALEIIAEKTRRLWWGQQLDLAAISWTALLAVEGRRRRIPHLWAYALLPHLVSLSFAQNLFYVALLQTPVPIRSQETRVAQFFHRMLPKKPRNWFPGLSLLLVPLALNYLVTLVLPSIAGTTWFPTAVLITKILTLAPMALPAIAPASWGTVYSDLHEVYPEVTKLFNLISAASALLHARNTVCALLYNLPNSYKHRHSIKIPLDTEKRSEWERTATSVEKVLGSMTDHPAVAAAGKDALHCALSLGLWAAVRATDVGNMLHALYSTSKSRRILSSSSSSSSSFSSPSEEPSNGKRTKTEPSPDDEEETTPLSTSIPPLTMNLRRRDRHKKTSISSIGSSNNGEDGIIGNHQTAPKRRGRPRKVKPEPEPSPDRGNLEPEEDGEIPGDKTYQPTPAVKADVQLGDVVPDDDFDWEPAAFAWGLTALGGLGLGSAAVFGAEALAR